MIDIHNHIIQGVDDGSEDLEMSLDMARIYLQNGITKVIGTPHYIERDDFSLSRNKRALEKLREELKKNGLKLEVYLGNEVYISMDLLKEIEEERVATLNGSRYILIEFPMRDIPIYAESLFYNLLIKGYIPIIAHPERYFKIQENPNILFEFIKRGALAQLNLSSLEGFYGKQVKRTSKILLKHKMIHFLGTDSHSNGERSPEVQKSLKLLKSIISPSEYISLSEENPNNILENRIVTPPSPRFYRKKIFTKK